jgi:leader peptidase (prepilin peptidase)/N-methyltransferase
MTAISHYFAVHSGVFFASTVALGLAIGSFLNVVIHRLPAMLERRWRADCQEVAESLAAEEPATGSPAPPDTRFDLIFPRSQCPHCGHMIAAIENIPILSFLFLKGKCSACGQAISWRYPLVELLTAVLSVVIVMRFGVHVASIAALLFTWSLIALTVIDYDRQILPDVITLPLLWLGLLFNLFDVFVPLHSAVIGAMVGYLSLWSVYQLFKLLTGKEGMGYGDFKMFAALGAWVGWQNLPLIILLASFLGAAIGMVYIVFHGRSRHLPIPFGPFLCFAGWVALLWGDTITRYYLHVARF